MKNITVEFAHQPKVVYKDATLTISSDSRIFVITKKDGTILLFPFESVVCVQEQEVKK